MLGLSVVVAEVHHTLDPVCVCVCVCGKSSDPLVCVFYLVVAQCLAMALADVMCFFARPQQYCFL